MNNQNKRKSIKDRKIIERLIRFFKFVYIKLFRINDSPRRVASGFALGIFSGILPGTGPIAAVFLAVLLRVNRASALIACLVTNTWLSLVTFLLAIKTGSLILGMNWRDSYNAYKLVIKHFHWADLFKMSMLKIILPVIIGYLAVAVCLGAACYFLVLIIFLLKDKIKARILKKNEC